MYMDTAGASINEDDLFGSPDADIDIINEETQVFQAVRVCVIEFMLVSI